MWSAHFRAIQMAARQDDWDEEGDGQAEDWGASWSKAYVGGTKVRQYTASAAETAVAEQPAEPGAGRR